MIVDQIETYLASLPSELDPIVEQAIKYHSFDDKSHVRKDGTVQIFSRPWVAPENYGLFLYPPADNNLIDKFEKQTKLKTPDSYNKILRSMNGCFVYGLALYGLPKSMYSSGFLNRSVLYPFDLGIANQYWKYDYRSDINNLFYFGGREFSYSENVGYFMDTTGGVLSIRRNGKVINKWPSVGDLLTDEIREAEQMMIKKMPSRYKK